MTRFASAQAELFAPDDALPEGLSYAPAFVTPAEEAELLALLAALPMQVATYHQYTARRRVHFIEPDRLPPPRREDIVSLDLASRSAYVMRGPARWGWQHGVPAVKAQRWSVTMRTGRTSATSASGTPAPRARAARGT